MITADDVMALTRLAESFTPTRPISVPDLLSGRINLMYRLMLDIAAPSQHVLIHGDRGVGKTSIARVLAYLAQEPERTLRSAVHHRIVRRGGHLRFNLAESLAGNFVVRAPTRI